MGNLDAARKHPRSGPISSATIQTTIQTRRHADSHKGKVATWPTSESLNVPKCLDYYLFTFITHVLLIYLVNISSNGGVVNYHVNYRE